MTVCAYHPHIQAIAFELNEPKGLYILGTFQKMGNFMYLAPKYM